MNYLFFSILFCLLVSPSHQNHQNDEEQEWRLDSDMQLLKLILQREQGLNNAQEVEKVGDPLENDIQTRNVPYMGEMDDFFEELEDDIVDDETLDENKRELLFDNLDVLMGRMTGDRCRRSQYRCPNQDPLTCISFPYLCDGEYDCADGSDEDDNVCQQFYAPLCSRKQRHHCVRPNGRHGCVPPDKMCDGRTHCGDGSDEIYENCASSELKPCEAYLRNEQPYYGTCFESPQCVKLSKWCDGSHDCLNGADEIYCDDNGGDDNGGDDSTEGDDDNGGDGGTGGDDGNDGDGGTGGGGTAPEDSCGGNTECREAVLAHNFLRTAHRDTPTVTWNAEVAGRAQAWAEELARTDEFEHSEGGSQYRMNSGENLYWSSSRNREGKIIRACKSWYEEEFEGSYDYEAGRGSGTGHFTQLIWDDSIEIGCGVAVRESSGTYRGTFVACQYSPPGNYRGAYTAHVHRPLTSPEQRVEELIDYVNNNA